MKRISSFLVVAALITGMAGCVSSPAQYDLIILSTEGGKIATLGEGTVACNEGEVVNLVAEPEEGYQFVNWTGDVGDIADVNAATTTITVHDNCSVTANFEEVPEKHNLSISSTAGGSVAIPGEGEFAYDEGEVVDLVAEAEEGFQFVNWTGDVDTIDDVEVASTTITVNGDCSITASFGQIPPEQWSLTTSSTAGGSVTVPGDGTFTYDVGTVVSLVATPATGYQFVNWTGDVVTIANVEAASTTVTMNGDYSVTANFERIPLTGYTLTVAVSGSGLPSGVVQQHTYAAGTVVQIVATPPCGYQFVDWTGDVDTIADVNSSQTTITMNGDYFITANFARITVTYYTLTVAVSGSGSTSPAVGQHAYAAGTVVPIIATPAGGYRFVNWTGNVGTIANVNAASTIITMNGDYFITANFEAILAGQYSLTTSSTTGGSVTAPGETTFTYDAGTVVSLVATPATGYHFVNWTGNVGTITNVNAASTTITMSGSYSVVANFLEDSPIPPGIGYTEAQAEALIIVLVNGQRQQSGLSALSEDPLLTSLAREHSISMVVNDFFSHERYPGDKSFDYGQLPGTIRGENIAMIPTRQYIPGPYLSLQQVCEWAVSAWMGSSGHRENILRPSFTRTGVGVAFSEGGDYLYITQMFEGYY